MIHWYWKTIRPNQCPICLMPSKKTLELCDYCKQRYPNWDKEGEKK